MRGCNVGIPDDRCAVDAVGERGAQPFADDVRDAVCSVRTASGNATCKRSLRETAQANDPDGGRTRREAARERGGEVPGGRAACRATSLHVRLA